MKTLFIDIETFASASLKKCGVYRYAESPDFGILLFGYSIDGNEVKAVDLARGEKLPEDVLDALTDDRVTKWAQNASFERICLSRYLGLPQGEYLDPALWRCSMVWSAYMGLPLSLEGAGAVLGLEKQKLAEGKDLVRYFCVPCRPTKSNGGRTRNLPEHDPGKWERFKRYNIRDVETEMQICRKLSRFPVPEEVWDEYHLSEEINDRGIRVDMPFVKQAIALDALSRGRLTEEMKKLTGLENPNSVVQMKGWLAEHGLETHTLGKKGVAAMIGETEGTVAEALSLRSQLAKSSMKKYQAMENAACADNRCRGMFGFYGANRTGRFSSKIIQLQNLVRNSMSDLAEARALVRSGNMDALDMLYEDVPDTLSQLVRTAFIPTDGMKFFVADFSAIEARVIAWLAGEEWRNRLFEAGGDIYCKSASEMFGVPVEKHGINHELRAKGKLAELACICFDSPVLTDHGLVPIQDVTTDMKVWDGEEWVRHEGVVYRGEKEVITYEGLTATPDHLVFVEGRQDPVRFELASSRRYKLIQTGDGERAVRLSEDYIGRANLQADTLENLCVNSMRGLWQRFMERIGRIEKTPKREMHSLPTEEKSQMAGSEIDSSKTALRESEGSWVQKLWCAGDTVRFSQCDGSGAVFDPGVWLAGQEDGTRQDRHQQKLCTWKSAICKSSYELHQSAEERTEQVRTGILAIRKISSDSQTVVGNDKGGDHQGCAESGSGETKKLEADRSTARVYDIQNAGRHHRFTVSGKLVHNCGYGGSVGALKAMGALEMGITEEELKPLVDAWRQSNPNIVRLWWDVDRAVKKAVKEHEATELRGLKFFYQSGMLFIRLPSGRVLSYVKPRMGENRFGGESVTYEGIGATKKWERIETFGAKTVENLVQGTARDILMYAMKTLRHCSIVAHCHDEIIIEADPRMSLEAVCEQMGRTPPWAEGLVLRADGYVCDFYKKS